MRHVGRDGAETEVDVEEGGFVALEPARLNAEGAAGCGPVGTVAGGGDAAALRGRSS